MRKIPVADYLVEYFIANGVTDVFGYQGGMVCHIFDSLGLYKEKINYHNCGNEQGAAFAACGYAQATGKLGVCITTSGPGF
ncbi:thiamine pyrophosphate-dependent enzyme, probable carboxylase/decarboxylase/carboligase, partial [Lachnospiraceae bacterium JC7]